MKRLPFNLLFLLPAVCMIACQENETGDVSGGEWPIIPFEKVDSANPVLVPDTAAAFFCPVSKSELSWEAKDVFNPAAVIRNDTVFLLYRAEDRVGKYAGTSRIGLAWSTDGLHFTKHAGPVLFPDNDSLKKWEWEGGCEDPRVVEDDKGTYYMTYTAYDGDKARLMIASSRDLFHWSKHGLAFDPSTVPSGWSKSGSIVSRYENGSPVATRVDGKYWMFWGDTDIFGARSEDLINWEVVTDSNGTLVSFLEPRPGKFDSDLVEPGPPAVITDSGIVLLYNSRNRDGGGDSSLAKHTYTAAQALFDKDNPGKILDRAEKWFIRPDKPFEILGQVNQVCFVEGLVRLKGRWLLYYGTADSKIAVAVSDDDD